MSITTEKYPDIFDDSPMSDPSQTAADERLAANTKRKRLYLAVRHLLREYFMVDRGTPYTTPVPSAFPQNFGDPSDPDPHQEDKVRFVAIIGQLLQLGYDDPAMGKLGRSASARDITHLNGVWTPAPTHPVPGESFGTEPSPDDPGAAVPFRVQIVPEFVAKFTEAVQDYNANAKLYKQAFIKLRSAGTGAANGSATLTTISCRRVAEVTRRLVTQGISPTDPYIQLHVVNAMSQTLGGVVDAHPSSLAIDLPDLDAGATVEILADNVKAISAIYYSAQLEDMQLHTVMDKIVEHFQTGMLPITRGSAADRLYEWIKRTPERLGEFERRSLYARTLGIAQGGIDDALPNREFGDLWIRFLSTITQKYRELASFDRTRVSTEQIHKAGRDLAVNLSLHGYGMAHPAALEMQEIVREILGVFDEPEVAMAYGVRDRWQLVDRVSALYLGGAVNAVKSRTMAVTGSKIINWLADRRATLASGSTNSLGLLDASTDRPTAEFQHLADWSERWLAVAGFAAEQAEQHVAPVDLQEQRTVPLLGQNIQLPANVRSALEQAGGVVPNLPVIPQA